MGDSHSITALLSAPLVLIAHVWQPRMFARSAQKLVYGMFGSCFMIALAEMAWFGSFKLFANCALSDLFISF